MIFPQRQYDEFDDEAHQANDFAVMPAYDFPKNITESECVAEMMKMYMEMTEKA